MTEDYLKTNAQYWDSRVAAHYKSTFYGVREFIAGKNSLNMPELEYLQNINGKNLAHLQCHFGQDTISLARLGAHVTGFDFSAKAIETAHKLAHECGSNAQFVKTDIYSIPQLVDYKIQYDIVFTSYGTIIWLSDLSLWAQSIAFLLKKGGKFIFFDFHPFLWTLDHTYTHIAYNYFNVAPIIETAEASYADSTTIDPKTEITFNHSFEEILGALQNAGLQLQVLREYDYSPQPCFDNLEETSPKKYKFAHMAAKLPMVLGLISHKL